MYCLGNLPCQQAKDSTFDDVLPFIYILSSGTRYPLEDCNGLASMANELEFLAICGI